MNSHRSLCVLTLFVTLLFTCCFQNTDVNKGHSYAPHQDAVFNFSSVNDLYKFLTYNDGRVPLISAHRGGPMPGYPENAIETFANIAKKMPAIIECDIALSKDSTLVLMHDETLNRTSNGKGKINKYTAQQLQDYRLKDNDGNLTNYQIPTLEEALKWGIGKVIFTLDVKKNVPYRLVIDAIRKAQAEAYVIVITYNANQAALVHNLAPELMISASIRSTDDLIRLNDHDVPDTRLVAFVGTRQADKKLTNLLHEHGIMCILGTIGNLDNQALKNGDQVYANFIENGADILSTDRPIEAAKIVSYYSRKRKLQSPYIN